MGLIKAATEAAGSVLHDQWKDYIRCEDLGNDILMKKMTTPNGIISKDSAIQVSPGQIAVIFQSGKVLDATAEEGIYTFEESSSPTFFAGQFGDVFKEMWNRFTYNGGVSKEQAVFFMNAKEIIDNKFGTPAPIPFQDWSHPIPNQMTNSLTPMGLKVKCFGKYTFKISDPAIFMGRIAGTAEEYKKDDIVDQMRTEVIASFQKVLNELGNSEHKVPVLELPSKTSEIKQIMDEGVFDQPIRDRGLTILGFAVESVTLDDDSQTKIDNYELSANSYMQKGTLAGAYAQAVQDAANNEAGAINGMIGVGALNMASGGMMTGVANPQQPGTTIDVDPYAKDATTVAAAAGAAAQEAPKEETPKEEAPKEEKKFCPKCGAENTGNFCTKCGEKLV